MFIAYAITITGLGEGSDQILLCNQLPPRDATGLAKWKPYLLGLPNETEEDFALRDGSSAGGEMEFTLGSPISSAVGSLVARYGRPVVAARFLNDYDATDTKYTLDTTGLEGQTLHAGLEAVTLGTEGPAGTYSSSTRALYGTAPQPFRTNQILSPNPVTLDGRFLRLYEYDPGAPSERTLIWAGVVSGRGRTMETKVTISAVSLAQSLTRVTALSSAFEAVVVSGSWAGGIQLEADTLPIAGPNDDRRCVLRSEDGVVVIADWTPTTSGGCTLSIPQDRAIVALPENGLPADNDGASPAVGAVFRERLVVGLDGGPQWRRSDGSGVTPSTNPATLVRSLLVSDAGGQGDALNLGVAGFGAGIPADLLDSEAWDAAEVWCQDRVLARFDLGGEDDAVDLRASEVIERLCTHLPLVIVHRKGLLTPVTRHTLARRGRLDPLDLSSTGGKPPQWDYASASALSEVTVKRRTLGGVESSVTVEDGDGNVHPFAPTSDLEARADGLDLLEASLSSLAWSERSAYPPPLATWQDIDRVFCDAEAGDVLDLEHPRVPSPDGGDGVEGATCQVISASLRLGRDGSPVATKSLTVYVHGDGRRFGRIAPSCRVLSASDLGGGAVSVVVDHDHYISGLVDAVPVETDSEAVVVGDVVTFCDKRLEPLPGLENLAVLSVSRGASSDTFVCSGASTVPGAGNILRLSPLDEQASDGRDWCWASSSQTYHWTDEAPIFAGRTVLAPAWQTLNPAECCPDEAVVDQALCVTMTRNLPTIQAHMRPQASATPAVWRDLRLHGRPRPLSLALPLDFTGVRSGTLTVYCDGVDESVLLRPVLVESDGRVTPLGDFATVVPGVDQVQSWTITPPREGFSDVRIEARSVRASVAEFTLTTEINTILQRSILLSTLGAPHVSLNAGSVYSIVFTASSDAPPFFPTPSERLVMSRTEPPLTEEEIHVWPVFSSDDVANLFTLESNNQLTTRIYRVGHVKVHHVSWSVDERYEPTASPDMLRAGLDPSAPRIRRLGSITHSALKRGRLLAIGPVAGPVEVANNPTGHGNTESGDKPRSPWGRIVSHPIETISAEETLWSCHVSHPHTAETSSGDVLRQREVRVSAAIAAYHRSPSGPATQVVRLQLVVEDATAPDTNPRSEGEILTVSVPVVTNTPSSDPVQNRAWLPLFSRARAASIPEDDIYLSDHAARGLSTLAADLSLVTLTVADLDDALLTSQRRIRLVLLPPEERAGPVGGDVVRLVCRGAYAQSFGFAEED